MFSGYFLEILWLELCHTTLLSTKMSLYPTLEDMKVDQMAQVWYINVRMKDNLDIDWKSEQIIKFMKNKLCSAKWYLTVNILLSLSSQACYLNTCTYNICVGRILSIAMIGGLPYAVMSIDILPGIWSICARCFVSTDRCAQCYDDVTKILHMNFVCLQWRGTCIVY